ncbi:MAG: hypothetical protein HY788_06020 [Deltaproteobacteria bacterium]|nr:hypothetical protein [Deltaproteobacteria bacterium]
MLDRLLDGLSRILSTERAYVFLLDDEGRELLCVNSVPAEIPDFDGRDERLLHFVRHTSRRVGTETLETSAGSLARALGEHSRLDYIPILNLNRPIGGLILVDGPAGASGRELDLISLFLTQWGGFLRNSGDPRKLGFPPSEKGSAQAIRNRMLFMAHQLKSPLAAVQQLLAVLAEGIVGELNEKQKELVQRALTRVRAHLDLLGDWLMGENAALGIAKERLGPVRVKAVLEEAVKTARSKVEMRGVQVVLQAFEPDITVQADKELLTSAFRRVIHNAIQFSPDSGSVAVALQGAPNGIRIIVKDQGPGVAPKDLPFVFDDFFHSKDRALQDKVNSGTGLSLAKKVIEAHDGWIRVRNRPEGGFETELFIPTD